MRYTAMQLRLLLHSKFPDTTEDDILKIVGNLVYYRYMNPAIVAPDAFDIIDVGVDQQLTPEQVMLEFATYVIGASHDFVCSSSPPEQRRNLASIAKVLQHASAGKMVRLHTL